MNWLDGLLAFEKVANHKGFSRAARDLQLPTSIITKRIQWLEQQWGFSLFSRTTRQVVLTEAGEQVLHRITPLLEEWQAIQKEFIDYQSEPQGNLSICLPSHVSSIAFFVEAFRLFLLKYPKIHLKITSTAHPIDLIHAKVDVFIATEKYLLDPQNTIGLRLMPFSYQCYAAPDYLAAHGIPQNPGDLTQHNCLIFREDYHWELAGVLTPVSGNYQSDSGDSLINTCIAGCGLSFVPSFMVQQHVSEQRLHRVLDAHASKCDWLTLFYVKHRYKPKKITLFNDFMCQYVAQP